MQGEARNRAEAGGMAPKCIGLTFFSPPSDEASTTDCVEGEQEEQVEQEQQQEQVVVREGEKRGERWREARASSFPSLSSSAAFSLPSVSSFACFARATVSEGIVLHCSGAMPVVALSTVAPPGAAVPAGGMAHAAT